MNYLGQSQVIPLQNDSTGYIEKDSLRLAVDFLKEFVVQDSTRYDINDSIRQAIGRLINYIEIDPIETTINYLKNILICDSKSIISYDSISCKTVDSTELIAKDKIETIDSTELFEVDTVRFLMNDSIKNAIKMLINYVVNDSTNIWITNITNDSINIWLKNNNSDIVKFWLKDSRNDSISIWLQNINKNSMKVILEDGIYLKQERKKRTRSDLLTPKDIDIELRKIKTIKIEPPTWSIGGAGSFSFAQGYLVNWVKGGENSVSTLTVLDLYANNSKANSKWDNNAQFKYGILTTGEKSLRKNADIFQVNTKFGQKAINNWYYSLLVTLKSQIVRGYDYPNDSIVVSGFLAPAYVFFALGLDYKPSKKISVLISPITSKSTIVRDTARIDQTKYGLAEDKMIKRETGAYIKTKVKFDITKDILLDSKLGLFTNYAHNPQNIDIDWEVMLSLKINKYISTNISTHMIYDDDIDVPIYKKTDTTWEKIGTSKRIQFKEILSLGFSYKF